MQAKPSYDHSALALAVEAFTALEDVVQTPERINRFAWRIERWQLGIYYVVVVGEVKKGKSSLVNALLGAPGLLPVADRIASAVPLRLGHGQQQCISVHWMPDEEGNEPQALEIDARELPKYATETGIGEEVGGLREAQTGDSPTVSYIAIDMPHELLEDGLRLVDLPGLGGVFRHHSRLVWEYLEPRRVDHVCFVVDSNGNPLDAAEADCLRKLRERGLDKILFIQTKTDAADPEKVASWQASNIKAISEILEVPTGDVEYFPVSSKTEEIWLETHDPQDHEDSGFAALEKYLRQRLMREKKDRLAEPVMQDIAVEIDDIRSHIEELIRICNEKSAGKQAAAAAMYREESSALEAWQKFDFVDIQRELATSLRDAKLRGIDRIEDELGSAISTSVYRRLSGRGGSEREVLELGEDAKDECILLAVDAYESIEGEYLETVGNAFSRAAQRMEQSMNAPKLKHERPNVDGIETVSYEAKNRLMEGLARVAPSLTIGGMLGSLVGGALGGSIGGPVGAILGAIFGVGKALTEARERNREAALAKVKGVLDHASVQAQRRVQRAFRDTCTSAETDLPRHLNDFAKLRKDQLGQKLQAAERALRATEAEVRQEQTRLNQRLEQTNKVETLLRTAAGLS